LVSRESVSLSSAAAAAAAAAAFLLFFEVDPFVPVAEVGVAAPLSLFPAKEADSGVGAAGVEVADAGVIASYNAQEWSAFPHDEKYGKGDCEEATSFPLGKEPREPKPRAG
jgi:hypothetical protein